MIKIESLQRETSPRGQRVTFWTHDVRELDEVVEKYREKPLCVEFKPIKKKRSINANDYLWALTDQIADVIHSTKNEVYRNAVREVGVFSDVAVQRKELSNFIKYWTSQGIGYMVDIFDSGLADNKGEPMKRVRVYLGSSKYDTKQMSRLIDYVVEEAKGLGITTETPDEIARIKSLWGNE